MSNLHAFLCFWGWHNTEEVKFEINRSTQYVESCQHCAHVEEVTNESNEHLQ